MPSSLRSSRRPLVLALGVLMACACRGAADTDSIRALVHREVEAFNREDLKSLAEIWSQEQEIVLFDVEPPGRFEGWEAIGHLYKNFFDRVSDLHLTIGALRASSDGRTAYASYDWTLTGRMGDYALDDHGQATSIYRKEKGGWRLVHEHDSSLPAAAASPSPAPSPAASPAASSGRSK